MELSSLSLATAINSRGIYVVQAPADGEPVSLPQPSMLAAARTGCCTLRGALPAANHPQTTPVPQISPDTVLRLILPESHGAVREEREYSLEELKELLNKLMLMSGRKDQNSAEVEVFSEVSAVSGSRAPAEWPEAESGAACGPDR